MELTSPMLFHPHVLFVHDSSKILYQNSNILPTEAVLLFFQITTQRHPKTMIRHTQKQKVTVNRKRKYFTMYMRLLEAFSWCKVKISSYL